MKHRVAAICVGLSSVVWVSPAPAQPSWLTGYLQTVPLFTEATPFSPSNVSDFNRFRLTLTPSWGPFSVETSYEHALTFQQRRVPSGFGLGGVPSGGEWLPLQRTLTAEKHVGWRHRLDRFNIGYSPSQSIDMTVGRQAVSWGTTLFLTPADPFLPFNPSDPFRQFRGGVDAARLRIYPGPLSTIDVVVRATETLEGEEVTALARGLATWRNWELSGWGGSLYGDAAAAVGAAGGFGAWAVRIEAVIRDVRGRLVGRGALGLDRILQIAGRDLHVVFEYQRDGLAAASPDAYLSRLLTPEFSRGELQVLGRDEAVAQAAYQIHPLWNLAGFAMWNHNDDSVLVAPSVTYNASETTTIAGGVYLGFGDDTVTELRPLPSEFGLARTTGYLSVNLFF